MSDALCIIDNAQVAQLVEQRTENPRVGSSILPLATISRGNETRERKTLLTLR